MTGRFSAAIRPAKPPPTGTRTPCSTSSSSPSAADRYLDGDDDVRVDRIGDGIAAPQHVDRPHRGAASERLEAERGGRDERAGDRAARPPLLAEPTEQRPADDAAEDDGRVADEEAVRVRE